MTGFGVSDARDECEVLQRGTMGPSHTIPWLIRAPAPAPRGWIFRVPYIDKVFFSIQRQV
jgi:hypothetical protein